MQEGLFHFSVKMIQRSKGRSATAAIAYRAGIDITDERTGERFDYRKKTGVSYSEIVLPKGAQEKYRDRNTLWNAVEQAETRKNSGVAREFELALPYDLPRHVREQLASDIARYIVDRFEVPADANCHDPHPRRNNDEGDKWKNYHVHVLSGTRKLTAEGFTDKVRELDNAKTGSRVIEEIREHWAHMVNGAYAKYGIEKFIDHRSNEQRGIERAAQIHVGVNQDGDRAVQNAAIIAANANLAQLEQETAALQLQIENLIANHAPVEPAVPLLTLGPFTTKEAPVRSETAPVESRPSEQQRRECDLAEPARTVLACHSGPGPLEAEKTIKLDKVRRYRELEELQKKAGTYGRAIEALRDQLSNAASFQRELDGLSRPTIIFRILNSKRWQAYEQRRDELQARVETATIKANKLRAVVKEYRQHQQTWDSDGHAEHKALFKELGYDVVSTPRRATDRALTPEIYLPLESLQPLAP